jgi:hypothetical protein
MTAATTAAPFPVRRIAPADIALAGFAGGMVDLLYASVVAAIHHNTPFHMAQSIAGGWLGQATFHDGAASVLLGLVTHFSIATTMALVFAIAARVFPALLRRPWIFGPLYGLPLYGVMYGVVLPLRWPTVFPKWDGVQSVGDIVSHVGVGLAIALVLSRRTASQAG